MEKIKILVVEDEEITALDIQKNLQKLGYTVPAIASSADEAITMTETAKPDLILMDILLKGEINGIEAAKKISDCYHIPIVFLTAYGDVDTFNQAKLSVPYGYLIKPFEPDDLRIAVGLALCKHQIEMKSAIEAERLKCEFLINLSHELRTPLNGIIGFSELMYDNKAELISSEHREYIKDIIASSYHLLQIINDIFDLSKVEYGKMEFHPEPVNLNTLICEVRNNLRTLIASKAIELEIKVDPILTDIVIDPRKLKQILYNYMSNAIKFSPDGGKIEVSARPENNDEFRIEVKDNGVGIDRENMNNLFVLFQKLDSTIAKKYPGTGVGLALTRRIVEAQGGRVGVDSIVGKGSTFFVILPCTPCDKLPEGAKTHLLIER